MFDYNSSNVDWCETNYVVLPYIAEFFNTVSNVPFILLPSIFLFRYRRFVKSINGGLIFLLLGMILIGLSSFYFHATLSFAGQILDELSIMYLVIGMFFYYYGKLMLMVYIPVMGLGTVLCFVYPEMNAYGLMCFAVPGVWLMIKERKTKFESILVGLTIIFGLCGLICWIIDRTYCEYWNNPNSIYPQFHAWWHLFVFISGCCCIGFLVSIRNRHKLILFDSNYMEFVIIDKQK